MQYLALDIGGKRTGVATGDSTSDFVSPITVIEATTDDHLLNELQKLIAEYEPDGIVVGLPLNMDGSDGTLAGRVRHLAVEMTRRFNLAVHLFDERLSSFDADDQMSQSGRTHKQKKQLRDALAASTILRDFIRTQAQQQQ